jgi:hypothetical protein
LGGDAPRFPTRWRSSTRPPRPTPNVQLKPGVIFSRLLLIKPSPAFKEMLSHVTAAVPIGPPLSFQLIRSVGLNCIFPQTTSRSIYRGHAVKRHDDVTREEIGTRMDELVRRYAETHDDNVKHQLEQLSLRLGQFRSFRRFRTLATIRGKFSLKRTVPGCKKNLIRRSRTR